MIIKWFPKSWLQIKSDNKIIYIDPSYMSTYFKKYKEISVYSRKEDDVLPKKLEPGDIILISHIHKDHCKEITINRLSNDNTIIYSPKYYSNYNQDKVRIVRSGDMISYNDVKIEVINAYNTIDGSSIKKVHKVGDCVGYIISIKDIKLYFAGDTDIIPEINSLKNVTVAVLPIGGTYTMNIQEAKSAALNINPKIVIPVHHLKANPLAFKELLKDSDIEVKVLDIGEELVI